MCIIEPPPSQGLIRYPLGSISALTKFGTGGMLGPFWVLFRDRSQTCAWKNVRIKRTMKQKELPEVSEASQSGTQQI